MNASPPRPAPADCFHCGEALPATPCLVTLDGAPRAFCCDGCAGAAQWIRDAHLDDYYRLRSDTAGKVEVDGTDFALWDRDDLLRDHVREMDGEREITVLSDGMRCAACAWLVDRALRREPGVVDAGANAVTGRIRIRWDPARTRLSLLLRRVAGLGYRPFLGGGEAREQARRAERNRWLIRLGVAGLGATQAMMFAEALYLDTRGEMSLATRDFFRWVTLLVSSPVVFYAGWPFIAGMLRELRESRLGKLRLGMDTLIASATLLAYGASVVATLRGGPHVWFDAAVMFVFLLLAARMIEQRARSIASAQVDALARARPALATRELADGSREAVPLAALQVGDIACMAAGDAVPADGVLLDDEASFEEALLTGESGPVHRLAGESVFAGTVCRERPARITVREVGTATRLSQLTRLVEQAQAHRPPLARLADRIAGRFVSALLLVAVVVYAGWRIHDPSRAFEVTLALLIISCPCALSLSIPAVLAAAHGALARLGVLALRPDALESLAGVTDMVFDKTGTLSDGRPVLADVETFGRLDRSQALQVAAALERDSGHPLAHAFKDIEVVLAASDVRTVTGAGIEGVVDGNRWRLGQAAFVGVEPRQDGGDLWLGDDTGVVARIGIRESTRTDARSAMDALTACGLRLHLSSGDSAVAVARIGDALGIADVHARQTPEQKLAFVRKLQADGRCVAMVGDGINDAPVLAGADVSLAMAEGAALAQHAADLVVTHPSLRRIPEAVLLARRARRVIRQNLAWALGYNLLALPLAAAGMVTPWMAAVGMALSSLTVTLNALRLTRWRCDDVENNRENQGADLPAPATSP